MIELLKKRKKCYFKLNKNNNNKIEKDKIKWLKGIGLDLKTCQIPSRKHEWLCNTNHIYI